MDKNILLATEVDYQKTKCKELEKQLNNTENRENNGNRKTGKILDENDRLRNKLDEIMTIISNENLKLFKSGSKYQIPIGRQFRYPRDLENLA